MGDSVKCFVQVQGEKLVQVIMVFKKSLKISN